MKFFRFADIPLENFACPPEIIAASGYIEANIGNFNDDDDDDDDDDGDGDDDDGDDDKADDCNISMYLLMDYVVLCTY